MLRLKEVRKKAKMSQQSLATMLGVTQATLSGWENEKYEIDNKSLMKCSKIFDVPTDYLLGITETPSFNNITNTNGVVENVHGTISINTPWGELSKQEQELIRIYNTIDVRKQTSLMQYAYELEDLVGNPKYTAAPDSSATDNTNIGSDIADTITKITAAQTAAKQK